MNSFNFNSLIGNRSVVSLMTRSLANGSFPQVTVFSGVQGTGKSTCANNAAMALTCENPVDGQACLHCKTCKENMMAIKSSRKARHLQIINIPIDNSDAKMEELVTSIFKLEHGDVNTVYIISEAHRLGKYQDALLTELDSMPKNVFLILTTTKYHTLSEGMKSRAMQFPFQRITSKESKLLMKIVTTELGAPPLDQETEEMLLNQTKGVPRDIIKYTEFIIKNNVSADELHSFFGFVSDSELLLLFECMKSKNYSLLVESIQDLVQEYAVSAIIDSLNDFILRATFFVEGGISEVFDLNLHTRIQKTFDTKALLRISDYLFELKQDSSEVQLSITLLKIRRALNDSNLLGMVQNTKQEAARNNDTAKQLASEYKSAVTTEGFTQASNDFLKSFGKKQQVKKGAELSAFGGDD